MKFSIPLLILYAVAQVVDSPIGGRSYIGSRTPLLPSPQQSPGYQVSDQLPYIWQ